MSDSVLCIKPVFMFCCRDKVTTIHKTYSVVKRFRGMFCIIDDDGCQHWFDDFGTLKTKDSLFTEDHFVKCSLEKTK